MKFTKLAVLCVVLVAVIAVASCGGKKDDPKSLAKQTFDLTMQLEREPGKAQEIQGKMDVIEEKVSKLSFTKQLSYAAELLRLSSEAIKDAYASPEVQDAVRAASDALGSSEVQGALRSATSDLQDAFRATTDALGTNEVQDALRAMNTELQDASNELNEALNALRALGF